MAQTSPAEIKVPAITQIGFAVKDVERTAKNYWHILGIGPWDIVPSTLQISRTLTYHGKPAYSDCKDAFAQVGPVQLELTGPLEGPSIHADFITEHGEGINHLQYLVDSIDVADKHAEIMAKKGFPLVMGGHIGSNGCWAVFDTVRALKTMWEVVKFPHDFFGPTTVRYPANEAEISPAKVKVESIAEISIAVKSLEETMENYWNILGIGPWDVVECAPPLLHGITYYGKPGNYTMRLAWAKVGAVEIELVQPISGDNPYSDFICKHGEGIQSILFKVDDVNKTTQIMNQEGFPALTSGGFSEGAFACYDTVGPLKISWEAFQRPRTMPPMTRYP